MKKIIWVAVALAMLFSLCALQFSAEPETVDVKVTIANGNIVLAMKTVNVYDADEDGAITISDALYAAHESFYSGGAAAGYSAEQSEWGLSLAKLWGIENGGSYGYYLNDTAAFSLADPVKSGDAVYAFVYTDTVGFSDTYSYFDVKDIDIAAGETADITLYAAAYDENWSPVTVPVEGATITLNGEKTVFTTDANGKAQIKFENGGSYIISAISDTVTLVPPICNASVKADNSLVIGIIAVSAIVIVIAVIVAIFLAKKRKK